MNLNKFWYYRLLKVVFCLTYLWAVVCIFWSVPETFAPRSMLDTKNSKVVCLSGNNKIFSYFDLGLTSETLGVGYSEIYDRCGFNSSVHPVTTVNEAREIILNKYSNDAGVINSQNYQEYYRLEPKYKTVGSWAQVIVIIPLFLFILTIIFEVIRRIFFYVVFGTFRPSKIK